MAMSLGNKGYKSDINITPYIDILLVLLIIFMVATPMKKWDQQIRVPKPAIQQPKEVKSDSVILEVDLNHDIRINTMPVTLEKLQKTLYDIMIGRVDKNMFIRGDSNLPYGYVFQILDIAKRSGVADIALLGKSSGSEPTKPSNGATAGATQHR
ncbi:MAG: biopolymer transporter ExbD [Acidobacteriota bacterium]|jgi:biopolymer transport protein ExbD